MPRRCITTSRTVGRSSDIVTEDVRTSAFRDFLKAVGSSRDFYFSRKGKNENTTFPKMDFKSKFAPSDTIEIRKRSVHLVHMERRSMVRFHPEYFGYESGDGIEIREPLPPLTTAVRLQHLREGDYYFIVPRSMEWVPTDTTRVCAIDPGVRQFMTVYDPSGRTLSVTNAYAVLMRRFDAVDRMKRTARPSTTRRRAHE